MKLIINCIKCDSPQTLYSPPNKGKMLPEFMLAAGTCAVTEIGGYIKL